MSEIVAYENGNIELKVSNDKEVDEKVVCADFALTTKHGSLSDKIQTRFRKI